MYAQGTACSPVIYIEIGRSSTPRLPDATSAWPMERSMVRHVH